MQNRIVIITGASGGLGQTVTRRWLEAGARVVAVASSAASLDQLGAHERLATGAFDLTTEMGANEMVAFARDAFGVPDTLLHLAGGFAMGASTADDAPKNWEHMMRLNAGSAFYAFRAVVPSFRERGGGWILGISSRAAQAPSAKMAAYAASKAALNALVKSMGEELRGEGIHVNAIATSTIDTPANRAAMGDASAEKWVTPDQIADASLFVCSPQAQAINGAIVDVFGRA